MVEKDKFEELDPSKIIQEMRDEYWRGLSTPEAAEEEDRVQVLLSEAGGERFAMDALVCRTITKAGHITRVPRLPVYVLGVINLRGEIISVVDLGLLLGLKAADPGPKARLIVVESQGVRVGFSVSRVLGIEQVPLSRVQEPPTVSSQLKGEYLKGHLAPSGQEGWTTYLNMEKLVHGPELTFRK